MLFSCLRPGYQYTPLLPGNPLRDHILPNTSNPLWVEDSKDISKGIGLSKRELFALIILAHLYNRDGGNWVVGYSASDEEPNDEYITNGVSKVRIEHKVIAQMESKEVLAAILSIYEKNANKGPAYGKDRVLVIQPNKPSDHGGLIKISDLRNEIGDQCSFEQVLTLSMVSKSGEGERTGVMHIIQHYPGKGIAQVDFDLPTGNATVPHYGLEELSDK